MWEKNISWDLVPNSWSGYFKKLSLRAIRAGIWLFDVVLFSRILTLYWYQQIFFLSFWKCDGIRYIVKGNCLLFALQRKLYQRLIQRETSHFTLPHCHSTFVKNSTKIMAWAREERVMAMRVGVETQVLDRMQSRMSTRHMCALNQQRKSTYGMHEGRLVHGTLEWSWIWCRNNCSKAAHSNSVSRNAKLYQIVLYP